MIDGERDTEKESIHDLFLKLSEPKSYFAGYTQTHALPTNIVLFRRHELPGGQHSYHHRHVLIYALDVEGTVIIDGTYLRLHPGEAVLVFPHQFHYYAELSGDRISWLFITFELASDNALEPCRYRTMMVNESGAYVLQRLISLYPLATTTADAQEVVLLTSLLLEDLRRTAEKPAPAITIPATPGANLVEAAGAYVYRNLSERFTVAEVADAIGCSESHLRAAFRQTVRTSFGRYLRGARLHRAQGLLITSEASITQIAEHCGYDSVSSFSRAFTAFTGETPSAWRRRTRSKKEYEDANDRHHNISDRSNNVPMDLNAPRTVRPPARDEGSELSASE